MEEVGITRSNDQEVHEQYVFDVTTLFQTQGLCFTLFGVWFSESTLLMNKTAVNPIRSGQIRLFFSSNPIGSGQIRFVFVCQKPLI